MRKKFVIRMAAVIAAVVCCMFAWRIGYANAKHTDNIPSPDWIAQMDEAAVHSKLEGYHVDQLSEVLGKPQILEGGEYIWELNEDTSLLVFPKPNGIAVSFKRLKTGEK